MKLMASLAPARAEIETGVVAKADQKLIMDIGPQAPFFSQSKITKKYHGDRDTGPFL